MGWGGFSFKRASGITKRKAKISRATKIPMTKSGRQRKVGKAVTGRGCLIIIGFWITLAFAMTDTFNFLLQADQVYTWKDDEGTVHITNTPPPTDKAEEINITVPTLTPEEMAFRAAQETALKRMGADIKQREMEKKANEAVLKHEQQRRENAETAKKAQEALRKAQIQGEIGRIERNISRYRCNKDDVYNGSVMSRNVCKFVS